MTASVADAWKKSQAELTLRQLRRDYPGYTDNELYAIWCVNHGKVPLDSAGKVILEQWKIHGEEDGKHVEAGEFRVSRALFGRAQKAKKGMEKPKRKTRTASAPAASAAGASGGSPGLSPRALEFAQNYDQAAKLIDAIVLRRREIEDLSAELREVKPAIVRELADACPDAAKLLKDVGAIK